MMPTDDKKLEEVGPANLLLLATSRGGRGALDIIGGGLHLGLGGHHEPVQEEHVHLQGLLLVIKGPLVAGV